MALWRRRVAHIELSATATQCQIAYRIHITSVNYSKISCTQRQEEINFFTEALMSRPSVLTSASHKSSSSPHHNNNKYRL